MDKQLEGAQKALAAAKAFRDEHATDGDNLPAEKLAEYRKMLDTAEALSDAFRANKQARELDEQLGQFSQAAAQERAENERALPESLKGQPSKGERIRLAALAAAGKSEGLDAVGKDASLASNRFYCDLDLGKTMLWMDAQDKGVPKEELALVIGTPSKGGYWTPDYWERVIVTEWRRIEGVMQVTTPMVTGDGNTIYIQQRTQIYPGSTAISHGTDVSTYQVAEQGAYRADAEPSYARVQLEVYKYLQKQAVSSEILEDGFINVPNEVGSFIGQWFGELMEQAWTNGTGSGQPKGVMHGIQSGQEVETAATGNPTLVDFHKLIYGDKRLRSGRSGYSVLTNRAVWGEAVRNVGANYLPWWGVDLNSEGQMVAFGYPVVFGTFINPSTAANANPVGFGNWNRYLRTRIVNQMRMTISDIAESDTDDLTYRFRIRFGSQLTDANQAVFLSVHS